MIISLITFNISHSIVVFDLSCDMSWTLYRKFPIEHEKIFTILSKYVTKT